MPRALGVPQLQEFPVAVHMLSLCLVFICLWSGLRTAPGETCPAFTALGIGNALMGTDLKVKLLLYTRQNQDCAEELNSTASRYLEVARRTTFIIHGYRLTGSAPRWLPGLLRLLLAAQDTNIILVDWNRGATTLNYSTASRNCKKVAEILKKLMDEMLTEGASLDSFHLIGVSLGAHIAGFVGQMFAGALGRITGLDPAGPLYRGKPPGERLDPTDAQFVDVIHSDTDGLGYTEPLGHVDFYPNGGADQPGCPLTMFAGNDLCLGVPTADSMVQAEKEERAREAASQLSKRLQYFKCDHQRSVLLFMASLRQSCNITAYPCGSYRDYRDAKCTSCQAFWPLSCPILGYHAHEWKSSLAQQRQPVPSLFFDTADQEPFCIYHYLVDVTTWNKDTRRGSLSIVLADGTGQKAESTVTPEAAAFRQYNQITLLVGFDQDIASVERISLTFSTGSVLGPRLKLRIMQMRLRPLTNPERPQLCRYDLVLKENTRSTFKPIPCWSRS